MPHFILFLSLPVSICSIFAIDSMFRSQKTIFGVVSICMVIISIAWSGSEQIRMVVKGVSIYPISYDPIFVAVLSFVAIIALFYVFKKSTTNIFLMTSLLIATIFGNVYRWTTKSEQVYIDGAREAVNKLEELNTKSILVIHDDVSHEYLLPQFAYYSAGWNLGWQEHRQLTAIKIDDFLAYVKSKNIKLSEAVMFYTAWDRNHIPSTSWTQKRMIADSYLLENGFTKTLMRQYVLYEH
jgi:hypothetical protein